MKTPSAFLLAWIVPFALASFSIGTRSQNARPAQTAPKASVAGQTGPAAAGAAPRIDAAKETAIRNMFEAIGTEKLMQQVVDSTLNGMRPTLIATLPPGEYRERLVELFFQRFQSKFKPQALLDVAVPIYDKYFTKEEIEGLTHFYKTPLGQKTLSVLPQTLLEMQTESRKIGERIGQESMTEVLEEHPELKKALEEASDTPKN